MADTFAKIDELVNIIGREHVKTDPDTLARYTIDRMTPGAVIFPKDAKEIAKVVKLANREKLAIIPWGSGSQINAGLPPRRMDLVVCTRRLNHMIDVDTQNLTITVQAGVKFRDIQARLATEEDRCYLPLDDLTVAADDVVCSDRSNSGSFLPIDPPCSETATIGGVIASNASGPRRLLYNLPRDAVLGIRFVTPRGDIPGSGGKTVKNVSGYDISKLLVGSMGSLGIITEITFRLLPLPEKMQTLLMTFKTFDQAAAFSATLASTQLTPAAVEVFNAAAFERIDFGGKPAFDPGAYALAVALEAFTPAVDRMLAEIKQMAAAAGAAATGEVGEHDHLKFWLAVSGLPAELGKSCAGLIRAKVNYRISEWQDMAAFIDSGLRSAGIDYALQVHSGSGICYLNLLLDQAADGRTQKAVDFMSGLLAQSRKAGGNTVVQQAPSELKRQLKIWGETGSDFIAMKTLKENLDPNGVMNPGRFVGGL